MISLRDVYHVVAATIPLYVVMILAYISVRWGKLFSPEQCSGINKFVAKFSIPLLSFQVISGSNLYKVNLKLLLADFIQKFLAVFLLAIFAKLKPKGNLTWIITGLSVSTLPNTLILGIPLIKAIFGDAAAELLAQLIALQSLVWYNLLLLLFELNATKESYMMSPSEVAVELEVPGEPELEKDGVFMASQASIIACGTKKAILAMALKFVLGPVLMAISSIAVGLRGQLFRLAIVQAALPQGIVPFVFAKEYNIHPTILR
uniref:Auxin efflux carrier component n=1 Tax=Solanum tuberosum TaxID=4113 RepID=M0ZLX8_SOLTU